MQKLAVLINNLGASQMAYAFLRAGNRLMDDRQDIALVALYENLACPYLNPSFACMQYFEGYVSDGCAVSTDLQMTERMLRFPALKKRIFYVWDLEWVRFPHKNYRALQAVYGHPDLTLVARAEDHQHVLANAWNRPVRLVKDFDLEGLLECTKS